LTKGYIIDGVVVSATNGAKKVRFSKNQQSKNQQVE